MPCTFRDLQWKINYVKVLNTQLTAWCFKEQRAAGYESRQTHERNQLNILLQRGWWSWHLNLFRQRINLLMWKNCRIDSLKLLSCHSMQGDGENRTDADCRDKRVNLCLIIIMMREFCLALEYSYRAPVQKKKKSWVLSRQLFDECACSAAIRRYKATRPL